MRSKMSVLNVNYATEFVQVLTHGARYSCQMKLMDGQWVFRFKNDWWPVDAYTDEFTKYTT